MRFETFIALRYLLALRKQSFISVISLFAVCGVALGVAALIVVIGVMNGFSKDLRDKILGVNAHVVVSAFGPAMHGWQDVSSIIEKVDGVSGVTPFIYSEVMLSGQGGVKGLVLRGIDPDTSRGVLNLSEEMVEGSVDGLKDSEPFPGIVVGRELARRLGLAPGVRVNLLSPSGKKTAAGFTPQLKVFQVAGIFRTGLFEYDSSLGYVTVDDARELLGVTGDVVTGLEVKLNRVDDAGPVSERIKAALKAYPVSVRNWQDMNANLFAALKLEKTAMFIILAMIVLVGSFSIVTTLVMLVIQKTRDIAILSSLGAESSSIRRIFMLQGTLIGVVGTAIGFGLGIPISLLLKKYQFIKLPSNVYPVDYLPVRLDPLDLTCIGVAALVLCFLATVYPAKKAANLNPSEALRYE